MNVSAGQPRQSVAERLAATICGLTAESLPSRLHSKCEDLLIDVVANFYVANAAVLVPTFNDPADRVALGLLSELIPDRPVVGIHAVDLVWGLGTLHCLTQQQPAA